LKERAYQRAHEEGLRVLMPGAFGDELYSGEDDWLADLFRDGRFREAGQELGRHIRCTGWRDTLRSGYVKQIVRRAFHFPSGGRHLRRRRTPPVWLTSHSTARLERDSAWIDPAFELWEDVLGVLASQDSAYENFNASRHALELRHPYRDRRLVEFILTLPAYQLYNRGYYKYILRVAMRDILPQPILARRQSSFLSPLFSRGLERERDLLQTYFQNPQAAWRRYVRPDWLVEQSKNKLTPETDGPGTVVLWLCTSYSFWFQSFQ
jgi:asparagine synthase (glutamine-hydrolysing)